MHYLPESHRLHVVITVRGSNVPGTTMSSLKNANIQEMKTCEATNLFFNLSRLTDESFGKIYMVEEKGR